MTVGFQAFNAVSGSLQFDTNSYVFAFAEHGTITIQNRYGTIYNSGTGQYDTVFVGAWGAKNLGYVPDLVAYSCSDHTVSIGQYRSILQLDSTNTAGPLSYDASNTPDLFSDAQIGCNCLQIAGNATVTVDYWTFRRIRDMPAPTSRFGAQFFDASGNLCYDALAFLPLRVVTDYSVTGMGSSWGPSYSLPTGRVYAATAYGSVQRYGTDRNGRTTILGPGASITGGQILLSEAPQQNLGPNDTAYDGGVLIVDVTNYS